MAEITASAVKELRERTGAGMMDSKKALIETGGDLPCRCTSHVLCARSFRMRDVPDVHLLRWDYNSSDEDSEEMRRVLRRLRARDSLTITATAPRHPTWLDHVVLLRVELYYSCV